MNKRVEAYNEKREVDRLHMDIKLRKRRAKSAYMLSEDIGYDLDNPFDVPVRINRILLGTRVG